MHVFDSAFADVNEHFSNLITSLFPGGTGRLSLTDPENLLDTGVEVEVRPAGRNVRRLSLLSGGERSLVAMAYLFAVFRSRPSPFYLMDEVEAALDDVNLMRFLALVNEFREEAQLIIVSHQKRTMEAADALYGVTMAPGGSSKVVSQKVPRRAEADDPVESGAAGAPGPAGAAAVPAGAAAVPAGEAETEVTGAGVTKVSVSDGPDADGPDADGPDADGPDADDRASEGTAPPGESGAPPSSSPNTVLFAPSLPSVAVSSPSEPANRSVGGGTHKGSPPAPAGPPSAPVGSPVGGSPPGGPPPEPVSDAGGAGVGDRPSPGGVRVDGGGDRIGAEPRRGPDA